MHNLIGTRGKLRADGSLHYTATARDFGQRAFGLLLLGAPCALLVFGGIFAYGRIEEAGRMTSEYRWAIYALMVLGALLMLWAFLSLANGYWKHITLSVDSRGHLRIDSRLMRLRREVYPISAVRHISYWAEPHEIRTAPIRLTMKSRHMVTLWVWHVDIVLDPQTRPKRSLLGIVDVSVEPASDDFDTYVVRFRVIADAEPPEPGAPPPSDVRLLCHWLNQGTQVPVRGNSGIAPHGMRD